MPNDLSTQFQHTYDCTPEESAALLERYRRLVGLFNDGFRGKQSAFIVRAPGRVNLIGEHTDYNGYPVLPMALDRDILFAVRPAEGLDVTLINEHPQFGRRTFAAMFPVEPSPQGDWCNYVKAAVHGIIEEGLVDEKKAVGFDAVIGGNIPESAGLSSSSAMVVASALAFLAANNVVPDRERLADLLARAERFVGSEGGGMDQAVSLLAEAGHALRIDFFPLRTELVPLRKDITFVICNSLIRAPKSDSVRYAYNRRVVECRLATALLSSALHRKTGKTLRADRLADLSAAKTGLASDALHSIALEAMGEQPLSLDGIATRLGQTPREVESACCLLRDGSFLKEPPDGFRIWNRYRHVITEAERVTSMVKALRDGDSGRIGELMNQSHASCRDDYEISCEELEVLVSLGLEQGALGARLTGAGFGGCTVHAVRSDEVEQFVSGMKATYYEGYVKRETGRGFARYGKFEDVVFGCHATRGAGVILSDGGSQ